MCMPMCADRGVDKHVNMCADMSCGGTMALHTPSVQHLNLMHLSGHTNARVQAHRTMHVSL